MSQVTMALRSTPEAQAAVRVMTDVLASSEDTENSLRDFYQLLKNDQTIRPFVCAFCFDEFCDTIRKIRDMGMEYTDTGFYIPVVTFCYVTPLSAAMQYFILQETSKESFEAVMNEFFYGDIRTAEQMQKPFVTDFREGIRRAAAAQAEAAAQQATAPTPVEFIHTPATPHPDPVEQEEQTRVFVRSKENEEESWRAQRPPTPSPADARQSNRNGQPPHRQEIPRAAYVERTQKQNSAQKWRGMKWHWFITFISLPLGVSLLFYGTIAFFIMHSAYAIIFLAFCVWGAITCYMLAGLRRYALVNFFAYWACGEFVGAVSLAMLSIAFRDILINCGFGIAWFLINYVYYKKRADRFVN